MFVVILKIYANYKVSESTIKYFDFLLTEQKL